MSDRRSAARGLAAAGALALPAGWLARHLSSAAVRSWRPGAGRQGRAGELSVRTAGGGPGRDDEAYLLLHGLTASGDVFGSRYDVLADRARLVVPDLLGFGRSLDARRERYDLDDHTGALDGAVAALGLDGAALTVAGHSLGALVALHWAARRADVARVVLICAPLFSGPDEADERIAAMGTMERLFALEGPRSRAVCRWRADHRTASRRLAVALQPQWPVTISAMAVQHTWASYLGAMNGVIRRGGHEEPLAALDAAGVPVLLAEGARDRVPVPGRAARIAGRHPNVATALHPTARHELPITHPGWCVERLTGDRPALRPTA